MKNESINWIEILRRMVWLLFAAIVGYLLLASIFSTCYTGTIEYLTNDGAVEYNSEHTFFIRDAYLLHFIVFVIFSFILLRRRDHNVKERRGIYCVVLACTAAIMVYIVLATQYYPKSDQVRVMEIGAAIQQGDYSALETGGYLFLHPHQKGIVRYFQVLSGIFGGVNHVAFQLVNAAWILGSGILLSKIGKETWKDSAFLPIGIVYLLFLPYLFYSCYLYGTVVGEFFALVAFYMILLFKNKRKWKYLIAGSVSIEIAVISKSNFQIFLIAAVIYLAFDGLKVLKEDWKSSLGNVLFVFAIAFCFMAGNMGMDHYIKSLNNGKEVTGVPMIAYVAMGLQDGKAAPGWYNGYNTTVYKENNFSYELAASEAKEEIKNTISGYSEDIPASISFFVKKISSQWNNPTFQSLWQLEGREGKEGLSWLMNGMGRAVYINYTNLLHTWILAGVLLYTLLRFSKGSWEETLLMITFIGGVLFHTVWEAKSMYAMPFFLLLIPLCVKGYIEWKSCLTEGRKIIQIQGWHSEAGRKIKRGFAAGVIIAIVVCGISYTDSFAKVFARNEDTGIFDTYTQAIVNQSEMYGD